VRIRKKDMARTTTAAPAGRRALIANTVLAFFALGVSGACLGPALPWLTRQWGVRLDEGGALFTALFAGSCITVALSGLVLDRLGRKPVLVTGLACMTAGLIGIATAPSLGIALAWTFLLGLGWGCQDVTLNVFVADLYPENRNAALNLTNVFFGIGALVGPLAVGAALTTVASPQPVLWLLAGLAAVGLLLFLVLRFPPLIAAPHGTNAGRRALGVLREGYVLLTALMFFLYVGLEIGFGGWAYSFAVEGAHLEAGIAALVVSIYWIAFTVGRAAAGVASRRWPGAELVWAGALCGAVGAAVLALFPASPVVLFGSAVLLGVGFAPIFPTAFGLAAARYPAVAGTVSSVLVLGGSLGGTVLPYAQGRLLAAGGVPLAAGAIALCALAVAGLQLFLGRVYQAPPAGEPAPPAEPASCVAA
jgi:fucose permease